jgi:hypothetical protein
MKSSKIDPHTLSAELAAGEDAQGTSAREIVEAANAIEAEREESGSVLVDPKVENLSYAAMWRKNLKITVLDPFDDKPPSNARNLKSSDLAP